MPKSTLSAALLTLAASAGAVTNHNVDFSANNGGWIANNNIAEAGWVYDETGYWRAVHADNLVATLTSPTALNLGNSFTITLWHAFTSESGYDYGKVQYSTDGTTWNLVQFSSYSNGGGEAVDFGFTGNPSGEPLGQFYSETSSVTAASAPVYLRFLFTTDSSDLSGQETLQWGIAGIPVPEPSTYGLMLGGLALVGVVIRRRAKRA